MSIPVMDSVLRMQKGEFSVVAEDFTTCIHCGLCRFVCEDKVKPHNMGLWVRRSVGMSRDFPIVKRTAEQEAEQEWQYLLADNQEQRLQRAQKFRSSGRIET